ncbi:MAG: hypothetical protein ACU841_09970 [Gammaproteobacteria bacterium]
MKIRIIKFALAIALVSMQGAAMAYEADVEEDLCKKPKYTDFTLTPYKEPDKLEVAPESEFEFKLSVWADPKTLKLSARNENIDYSVESTTTFHRIKAKLPASLTGKFARINARVKAVLGCHSEGGWLIKVAENQSGIRDAAAEPASEPGASETPAETPDAAHEATPPEPAANSPEPDTAQ